MKYIFFLAFFFFGANTFAKNYYLSNYGSDSNSGNSPGKSWKTIDRLNKQKLLPGDSVLFKAGDTFTGTIVVQQSGTAGKKIVFSKYGLGAKPLLSGAVEVKNWTPYNGKIYAAPIKDSVYGVFVNNILQTNARFPNNGFLKMDDGFKDKVSFVDHQLNQKNDYWVGANIRFRTWDWEFRKSKVIQYANHKITIQDSSTNILSKGWGYFFDNKFAELDTLQEWYYSADEQKLFLIPESTNLTGQVVEAVVYPSGFKLKSGTQFIVIENLRLAKYDQYGIDVADDAKNISINNNSISDINMVAINFGLNSQNCVVRSNEIADINGRGISALEPKKMTIYGNNVSKIGSQPGYGISGVNGMIGIVIENIEVKKDENSEVAKYNIIKNNRVDSIGYVGIRMDGAESLLENNVVSNCLYQLSDGAAIYCWAKDGDYYTYNNKIVNNIIFDIRGNNVGTPSEENPIANGIYIDNNCYDISIEGNTIFAATGSGIHINSGSYNNTVSKNTIYDCKTGVSIAEWAAPNTTYGNKVANNLVFCIAKNQKCVELSNWILPSTHRFANFSNNFYVNTKEKFVFKESYLSGDHNSKITNEYSFKTWKENFAYDQFSSILSVDADLAKFENSEIFYNGTTMVKTFNFEKNRYYQLDGTTVNNLSIPPFSSVILLKSF